MIFRAFFSNIAERVLDACSILEKMEPSCECSEWIGFVQMNPVAVTFTCPKHGAITLDSRPLSIASPQASGLADFPPKDSGHFLARPDVPAPGRMLKTFGEHYGFFSADGLA
jgi:hypothetical protein